MRQTSRFISMTVGTVVLVGLTACGTVPLGSSFPSSSPASSPAPVQTPHSTQYPAQYPSQTPSAPVQKPHSNVLEYGRVTNMQLVQAQQSTPSIGLGAILGGVAGAVVGHQIGDGTGRDIATIAGAVGGAVAGNAIEKSRNASNPSNGTQTYRITVQPDNGVARTYDLPSSGELRVGDRVKIQNGQLFRY